MDIKSKAIVLRTVKYGDQSLIVDMLTERLGRVTFMVRLPKTKKGKLRKQFFQPMSIIAIVFDYRERSNMQHLRDVRIATPLNSLTTSPAKMTVAMFLAEFLSYVTRGEQGGNRLFGYVERSMLWLDGAANGFANFHIVFMTQLSRLTGFWPNLNGFSRGCLFDMREGKFVTEPPPHHDFLNSDGARLVRCLTEMDFGNMGHLRLSGSRRNQIVEAIVGYYRLHIPAMPEMSSLNVLRDVFS